LSKAAAAPLKPEELAARLYADRLILEQLTELAEVFKPSEIADRLKSSGLGLSTVRSLLASNPDMFAYSERRWVPASRVEGAGRPFSEQIRLMTERFGGPMQFDLLAREAARGTGRTEQWAADTIQRLSKTDPNIVITRSQHVVNRKFVFAAKDESVEDAFALNRVDVEQVAEVEKKLGKFDWRQTDAIMAALEKTAPVNAKALGAAAWKVLNPQDPKMPLLFDWKEFAGELLSIPGFIFAADGSLYPEAMADKWITTAVRLADKIAPTIEVEDATPLELKNEDVEKMIQEIVASNDAVTATRLLEVHFEITPQVRTFPDDMANIMKALRADKRVEWVGGDRFMKPSQAPDYIFELPEPFIFVRSEQLHEDGEHVDSELIDEGLNTSLRKLISHPLATDVLDEEILPSAKILPESLRLVLKPIHRELGTFPLSQFPAGWFDEEPKIQEFIFINPGGDKLQVWVNHDLRVIFGLFDWWLDQPVESGAVFSLTKTPRPNVLEFAWLDQTDPVVYISNQRMEELREIASRADDLSTFDVVREVMTHWPKGADFLTILWEVNVVRRTSRRMLASLLSSYVCFYQRSGSPVWHYDHKKVEQGFDKSKKKFIKKD
jgi:hypothetical protein